MSTHAATIVKWGIFRSGKGSRGARAYDYGSNQEQLLRRVGTGGTLWLITSRRKGKQPRRYHLAYKLVNCKPVPRAESTLAGKWQFVVRAQDWRQSRHFGYNDATDTVRRLKFTSGKPMSEVSNVGLRLLSIPELSTEDVDLLQHFQHKTENGRAAFISYSRADAALADKIESELSEREVSVSRDVVILHPGQEWEEALREEVASTDCFVALISPNAAKSDWVRKEVKWAIGEYDQRGLVKCIIPVVLPQGGWEQFPELHRFERWVFPPKESQQEVFDRLAKGIVLARQ